MSKDDLGTCACSIVACLTCDKSEDDEAYLCYLVAGEFVQEHDPQTEHGRRQEAQEADNQARLNPAIGKRGPDAQGESKQVLKQARTQNW